MTMMTQHGPARGWWRACAPMLATALIAGAVTVLLMMVLADALPAEAQSWEARERQMAEEWQRRRAAAEAAASFGRVLWIALMAGIGAAVGWFCSPHAKGVRSALLATALGLIAVIAVFNHDVLGSIAFTVMWWSVLVIAFLAVLFSTPPEPSYETTLGSARWASARDVERHGLGTPYWDTRPDGLRLGTHSETKRTGWWLFAQEHTQTQNLTYRGDRHCLTIAPTRSGKGTTQIVPNLLSYSGAVVVIDPKGENALITAAARRDMGQDVMILDPWGIAGAAYAPGAKAARFNPLDWLQAGDLDITENAMLLADALVMPQAGSGDRFWVEEAKALLQGLLLYVATDESEAGQRHLGRVRDLLLLDSEDLTTLFTRMMGSPHHVVASTGARCLQKEPKLLSNVLASAQAETHFLDSARLRESLSVSDFRFEDLKREGTPLSVYLVLPADRLHGFARWLRLMLQHALTLMARDIARKPAVPVLVILDEMPALGRLTMIEQAYGLMAGFGLQLWGIVQDCAQLKAIYGEGWETFVSNSGVLQYFGSRDRMTAEYFSALCGETTVLTLSSAIARVVGWTLQSNTTTETTTRSMGQRKLAFPDELMRLPGEKQLLLVENMHPVLAKKVAWFKDPDLRIRGVNLHTVQKP